MNFSPLTILIADDWPDTAESLAGVLSIYGHRVLIALDGEEAVEAAKAA